MMQERFIKALEKIAEHLSSLNWFMFIIMIVLMVTCSRV
jgi:hypothetical protein